MKVRPVALALLMTSVAGSYLSAASAAATDAPITLPAAKLADNAPAPTIDGKITEAAWMKVEPYSKFTQTDPIEGAPASEKTEVRLLFDKSTLYIGVICYDSDPSKIIVSQSRRDADLTETDAIILVLDTFNDNQNAFVFGTNPLGIQYDGQVASEGQSSGISQNQSSGTGGSQRGTIGSFNPNWDGDWQVKASVTDRGWEAEIAIPLKTLRYATGTNRTWGFNLKRNIRRKNEQVYLSPVQRGSDVYRVSSAAKLTGLDLPRRRDIKLTPFALTSANKDFTRTTNAVDKNGTVGLDVKWGVRPNLTADFTVNTDFAQVEADEEQVNLTRFDLFFPEKRTFFLENASIFQFGAPQQIDLFFSRRIGLSATGSSGTPIDIFGGGRLSGKVGGYNIGVLNMQTDSEADPITGKAIAPSNNFGVLRVQREIGRSSYGAMFVNRTGTGKFSAADDINRAYGVDANIQVSPNGKLFTFLARTDSPDAKAAPGTRAAPSTTSRTTCGKSPPATRRSVTRSIRRLATSRAVAIGVLSIGCSSNRSRSAGPGFAVFHRTPPTTRSLGSMTTRSRARTDTFISSRFNHGKAADSAPSSTASRIGRLRPSRSSTPMARRSSFHPASTRGINCPTNT